MQYKAKKILLSFIVLSAVTAVLLVTVFRDAEAVDGANASPSQAASPCNSAVTPFCDAVVPAPENWSGHRFKLSQAYPVTVPKDVQPWKAFDPTSQHDQYIRAVLGYFFEGNIHSDDEASFDPALNSVRGWYGAPWQDFGVNGREPIHGLTRERSSRPYELDSHQAQLWTNYAVGFYNAPGGVTIGRVWADHGKPNPALSAMPEGTIAAKLLFTTASVEEVPYLQGAPTWNAFVYSNVHDDKPKMTSPRAVIWVRLLQIDVAVKDSRVAGKTGWVFGTFVYGGGPDGKKGSGWSNVSPVGLMWGNDPDYSGSGSLMETWVNSDVHMQHLGYQGRLDGPVDNPASSCLSCHSTSESPEGTMFPNSGTDPTRWFRNLPSGTAFDSGRQSLDYSLQLSVGLSNFKLAQNIAHASSPRQLRELIERVNRMGQRPPRDGGPSQ